MVPEMPAVFHYVFCFAATMRIRNVLQGGLWTADYFLGNICNPLEGPPVCYQADGIPNSDVVCQLTLNRAVREFSEKIIYKGSCWYGIWSKQLMVDKHYKITECFFLILIHRVSMKSGHIGENVYFQEMKMSTTINK